MTGLINILIGAEVVLIGIEIGVLIARILVAGHPWY